MKPSIVTTVEDITNPYVKRILANVIGKDPMKVLERTPRRLRKLVKGLKKKQVRYQPAASKWSIVQIINHIADTELVLAFRLRMALAQSGAPLQATDQDKWATVLNYEKADVDEQTDLFTTVRRRNLAIWKSLSDEEWQRFGMHEERGKETVERIAQLYAGHDINHLNQIEAIRKSIKKKKKK
jgi:uncharacterized damage-inducible protein DinB